MDEHGHDIPDQDADKAPIADAADERSIARRKVRKKADAQESRAFWRNVFADPAGRREMWNILQQAGAFETKFATGPNGFPQPEATWFHAGQRELGQRLFQSWTIIDREGAFKMMDEHDPRFKSESKVD